MKTEDLIKKGYKFTENNILMDINIIHDFLSKYSTWAIGIPKETVKKSIENSICFAILYKEKLVAFARVITDKATFANLVDVFVLPDHREKGLSQWIMHEILHHADLQGLRRFTLATSTAHGFYEKFGFTALNKPEFFMERYYPNIYILNNEKICLKNP